MRLFVLALLVANAAFFTWRYNETLEAKLAAARSAPSLPANAPTLTLVGELDELPPRRRPPEAPGGAEAPPSTPPVAAPAPVEAWRPEPPLDAVPDDSLMGPPERATPDPAFEAATVPASDQTVAAPDTAEPPGAPVGLAVTPTPPATESPPPESPAPSPVPGTPSGVCVRIGPFTGGNEYAPLLAWLSPRSTTVSVETVTTAKRQLFWVYLEQRDAEEARRSLAELSRNGVRDTLLVNREGIRNAISLGVFSTQDAVNRRLAEVTRKGYQPLVVPRVETTDLRWLNVELASGYADKALIPAELRGNAGVEDVDCARLAGGPAR